MANFARWWYRQFLLIAREKQLHQSSEGVPQLPFKPIDQAQGLLGGHEGNGDEDEEEEEVQVSSEEEEEATSRSSLSAASEEPLPWDALPLWGSVVSRKPLPGPLVSSRERNKKPLKKILRGNWQSSAKDTSNKRNFRQGNRVLGVVTLNLGMLHLCTLGEVEGLPKRRKCREFHHYDGLKLEHHQEQEFVLEISFEGMVQRCHRNIQTPYLFWEDVLDLPYTNLRSALVITLCTVRRYHGESTSSPENYVRIGELRLTVLSIIEDNVTTACPNQSKLMDVPVTKFASFYFMPPSAPDTHSSQLSKAEKFRWYDVWSINGQYLVGRFGLQCKISSYKVAACSNIRGDWESTREQRKGRYSINTWVGNGVPSRPPENLKSVPESFSDFFYFINRVASVFVRISDIMNVVERVQAWSDFWISLPCSIASILWARHFHLEALPIQLLLVVICFLLKSLFHRLWGTYYVSSLMTISRVRRPKVQCARLSVGVICAELRDLEFSRLHVRVEYLPGSGGEIFDDGTSLQQVRRYPVGTMSEYDYHGVSRVHYFRARGRRYSALKRFMEIASISPSASFPFLKRRQYQRGQVLQNRSILWRASQQILRDSGDIVESNSAQSNYRGSNLGDDSVFEALEYSILQSVIKDDVLPWNQHTGRLVFYLRRSSPSLLKHETIGYVEVPVKDCLDRQTGGLQGTRRWTLPLCETGKYAAIGNITIQIQVTLPDSPEHFNELDRLRQEELEEILYSESERIRARKQSLARWWLEKRLTAHRNLMWLARLGDDIYSVQSLYRWAHPMKTATILCALLLFLLAVSLFEFRHVLLSLVLLFYGEGLWSRYKRVWFKFLFPYPKLPKAIITILGVKLKCSAKSNIIRVRNLLNSVPNDRDYADHYLNQRRTVAARNDFLKHTFAGVRYGGLWAGPLSYKWKCHRTNAIALGHNIRALTDLKYKPRFCVISPGYLRLYRGSARDEAGHVAGEGYDRLELFGGLITFRGRCLSLDIRSAIVLASTTHNGVPNVIVYESARQDCATWRLSLCCVEPCIQKSVIEAFVSAGCREVRTKAEFNDLEDRNE
jgi:hypothetical protein